MRGCHIEKLGRGAVLGATLLVAAACATRTPPAPSTGLPSRSANSFERIDTAMNARIRAEGMQRSQVLETAIMLSDIHGPRLAGSSGFMNAANWARGQLVAWGIDNAYLEPWGKRGKGWELERFSVEM